MGCDETPLPRLVSEYDYIYICYGFMSIKQNLLRVITPRPTSNNIDDENHC